MKPFLKIFLTICFLILKGSGSLYGYSSYANETARMRPLLTEGRTNLFFADIPQEMSNFGRPHLIKYVEEDCLFEIEEEQDNEKLIKRLIPVIELSFIFYSQHHQSLSSTEKEYLNSLKYYCCFSTQRYIAFRNIKV